MLEVFGKWLLRTAIIFPPFLCNKTAPCCAVGINNSEPCCYRGSIKGEERACPRGEAQTRLYPQRNWGTSKEEGSISRAGSFLQVINHSSWLKMAQLRSVLRNGNENRTEQHSRLWDTQHSPQPGMCPKPVGQLPTILPRDPKTQNSQLTQEPTVQ